ncbi:MAG: rod shape-determining protein MreD [Candidatus Glassbacteria bacterium]|nr:rod shape-determining protein MreD [Candidatus Glassbacteria bacterium]
MSNFRFILFLFTLFFVHLLFYQYISVGEIFPDLFLVMVVYAGLIWGPEGGSLIGFFCGIAQDSFSFTYFGLHALAKVIAGFVIGKVRHSFFSNKPLVQAAIILVAKMAHDAIFYGIYFARTSESFWRQIVFVSAPSAVYTAVLGVVLFMLFRVRHNRMNW